MSSISIIIPVFNEQAGLAEFLARLGKVIASLPGEQFEVIAINDGSTDGTLGCLLDAQTRLACLVIIDFARNFGKEAAITAGLDRATGDAVIPMDADLQHPPELIPDLIAKWREGYDVVLAQRSNRETDGRIQRLTSRWFYAVIKGISDTPIPTDVGDFRPWCNCGKPVAS
jgi:glycosyltransferase involved in cell wall biosynthesis